MEFVEQSQTPHKETMNDRTWDCRLGVLPVAVHVGNSRVATFKYLKEPIWQRIQGWKEKMDSYLEWARKF